MFASGIEQSIYRQFSFPTTDGAFFFLHKWYLFPFWLKVEDMVFQIQE